MVEYVRSPRVNRFVSPSVAKPEPKIRVPYQTPMDSQLEMVIKDCAFDPAGFVLKTYGWGRAGTFLEHCAGPLPWQLEELENIRRLYEENPRIVRFACAAGRGVGKTTLASWLFMWHVACHPEGITTAMSVTGLQAESRLWREIRKWRHVWEFESEFEIKARSLSHREKDTWYGLIQMWNMDRLGAIRGTHEKHLGFIIDECSDIPDEVFREIEAGTTGPHNFLAYFSNPTRTIGHFADCFGEKVDRWHCVNVDARDVAIVTPQSIQEILEDCLGDEDADRFRVEVRGIFPRFETDTVIPLLLIQQACARFEAQPDQAANTPLSIGVDVASVGANKTVFVVRQGSYIREVYAYARALEQEEIADKLMELMDGYYAYYLHTYGVVDTPKERQALLRQAGYDMQVYCDSDGIGRAVFEMCRRRGYPVHEVHSGGPAYEDHRFFNRKSELWLRDLREWMKKEACLDATAPYFKALCAELMNVYYKPVPPNRSQVETKEQMRARGVPSPDHADALVYSLYARSYAQVYTMSVLL